jgi:plasmid stabilization system protein ParE
VTFSLHPEAEKEIADTIDFYLRNAGLAIAEKFLEEFHRAANFLVENPEAGTPSLRGRRTFPLHLFPHSIVYVPSHGAIHILVVRHQRRQPGYGAKRR